MKRIVLVENRSEDVIFEILRAEPDLTTESIYQYVESANSKLGSALADHGQPLKGAITLDYSGLSANGIAGYIQLTPEVEIEVIPKFMATDSAWQNSFLQFLACSEWGSSVLPDDTIEGSLSSGDQWPTILSRLFLAEYKKCCVRPLRQYVRRDVRSFDIVGDLDEESILLPASSGFDQMETVLTKSNIYCSIISLAAQQLGERVDDYFTKALLQDVVKDLGIQHPISGPIPVSVPSRHRSWAPLFELSCRVLEGIGFDYSHPDGTIGPGLVVRTAKAWEEFIYRALRGGFEKRHVGYQKVFRLGSRQSAMKKAGIQHVNVRPDVVVSIDGHDDLLIDAKYKTAQTGNLEIANSDIYEGLAFMTASGVDNLLLVYPPANQYGCGSNEIKEFCKVIIEGKTITAIMANPNLAVSKAGFAAFSKSLAENVELRIGK